MAFKKERTQGLSIVSRGEGIVGIGSISRDLKHNPVSGCQYITSNWEKLLRDISSIEFHLAKLAHVRWFDFLAEALASTFHLHLFL